MVVEEVDGLMDAVLVVGEEADRLVVVEYTSVGEGGVLVRL